MEDGKRYGTLMWLDGMNEYKGQEKKITMVEGNDYTLEGASGWFSDWWFSHEMLEPVEEKSEIEKINDHVREITIIAQDQRIRYLEERLEELKKQLAEQLLPCPFCGGKAIWWETDDEKYPYQIVCRECNCGTDECGDRQDAIDYWNRRV